MSRRRPIPVHSVTPPPQQAWKPLDSLSNHPFDGSSPPGLRACSSGGGGGGFNIDSGSEKKRGQPKNYSPDGNIALGLAPTPITSLMAVPGDSSATTPSEPQVTKHRGRPRVLERSSWMLWELADLDFTPYVIMVKAGEDIASKIMAFSQQ